MTRTTASIAAVFLLSVLVSAAPAFTQGIHATRAAQATPAAPANVGGEWTLNLATRNPTVFRGGFRQDGKKLTGYMSNETAEFPLTGTVEGSQVKLTWSLYESGEKIEITVTGQFEREAITGMARIGDYAEVAVSGQRTSPQ